MQHEQNCVFWRKKNKERNKRERGRMIEIHRLIDNQTDRQTDRQTEGRTDRQAYMWAKRLFVFRIEFHH